MAGDSGYEVDEEESRRMGAEHAAYLASQGYNRAQEDLNAQNAYQAAQAAAAIQETQAAAQQAQARADSLQGSGAYQAAQDAANELSQRATVQQVQQAYYQNPNGFATNAPNYRTISTEGLTASNPDWTGANTLYLDSKGNVKGVRTFNGVVPVESLNVLSGGKEITPNSLVQATTEDGQKLYLLDANDPYSRTTRNTGIPAIGGTVAQQAFFTPRDNSLFGTIGGDFATAAKDPAFWKFLAATAAIGGLGYGINEAFGVGGLGAETGAMAFPVAPAGTIPATPLGAGGMSAADAIAAAAEGGLGAEFGVQGALTQSPSWWSSVAGLIPEGAAGSLIKGGLTLGGLAALNALAPKQGTTGGSSSTPSLSADQLKAIVSTMPSAMGNYMNMAGNPYGYGGGTIDSANVNLANLFPGFSLPTTGPFYGAGRFGDAYAPVAASNTPISPTGLV